MNDRDQDHDRPETALGHLLEQGRARLQLTGREAARRAGISEARWRQVVTGVQSKAGGTVPVNPRPRTVVAMALAVDVDPADALAAARYEHDAPGVARLVADVLHGNSASPSTLSSGSEPESFDLLTETRRIRDLPGLSSEAKLRLVREVVALYEQSQRERAGAGTAGADEAR